MTRRQIVHNVHLLGGKLFTTGAGSEQGSSRAFLHRLCIILETVSESGNGLRQRTPSCSEAGVPELSLKSVRKGRPTNLPIMIGGIILLLLN